MQKKKRARKASLSTPQTTRVNINLSLNDLGQMLDGIRCRAEAYERTAEYMSSGEIDPGEVALECSDADEARKIAAHYRSIIADCEAQRAQSAGKSRLFTLAELESVAAVQAEFWGQNHELANKLYHECADQLSGMPGVWDYVTRAALILEAEAVAFGVAGEDYDWFQSVQEFAERLYIFQKHESAIRAIAVEVLTHNKCK
jgi:hypothetical protein